jgi:O-antigen ligase
LDGGAFAARIAAAGNSAKNSKGGLVASLFFVSLAAACAGSRIGYVWPWALSALALLAAGRAAAASRGRVTPLSAAVLGFAAWVALHTLLVSAAYTPAGLYHPLLLALGFAVFRRMDESAEKRAAVVALAGGAILAVWGLAQAGPMGIGRARAFFETPATFAAVLNLLLAPLLALALAGGARMPLLAIGTLLAAAVFASTSRGGLIALAAGLGVAIVLALRSATLSWRGVSKAIGVIAAGWILALGLRGLPVSEGEREAPPPAESRAGSSLMRLELYELSLQAWSERPFAGTGYLTFRHVFERGRDRAPSFDVSSETWFAHNDYLQTLQELGPLGLAALLSLAGFPLLLVYRRIPAMPAARRVGAMAAAAGLTTMACHALVDFPFYIPVCLLLYGALSGALDRRIGEEVTPAGAPARRAAWVRAARAGVATLGIALLLRPVLAESAAEWGLRRYAEQKAQSAALWLEIARRLEPADWRYHMYAGLFWDGVASASASAEAANHASAAFAAGVKANPLEVRNLLGLIAVHRTHARLLASPADRATREAWVARAEALDPYNAAVRRERALLESAR